MPPTNPKHRPGTVMDRTPRPPKTQGPTLHQPATSQTATFRPPSNLYTGPKLFAPPTVKTNLQTINKAIFKALEGAANAKTLKKMQDTIAAHSDSCPHFLILFRNHYQFRGLYEYSEKQNTIIKLDGIGPKTIHNEDIMNYYKFDSTKRQFTEVQTKHICLTIIAFTIQDHLWPKSLSNKVPPQVCGSLNYIATEEETVQK